MTSTTTTTVLENDSQNIKTTEKISTRISASSYRLLYRGSLALPDSEMILDGIAFVMQIAFKSPMSLISSPIPLGLESMRGRPLRLISTMNIQDVSIECFGDVSMYIHPEAFLTRSFFERTLCLSQTPLMQDHNHMRTSVAIRIGFGDGQGPDDSDILVFGQLPTSEVPDQPVALQLLAGRIAPPPTPSSPTRRVARPDDPLPRPHPLANLHLSPGRRGLKRKRSSNNDPFAGHSPFENPAGPSKGGGLASSALMAALADAQAQTDKKKKNGKIVIDEQDQKNKGLTGRPSLFRVGSTSKKKVVDKTKGQMLDGDGFVVPGPPIRSLPTKSKGKDREEEKPAAVTEESQNEVAESELETKNKTAIKKRTLAALEGCGISKSHPQFKDMYGWIHRGVAFAVRGVIKETKVDRDLMSKLIEVHLEMYFGGRGGKYNVETAGLASSDRPTSSSTETGEQQPTGLKIIVPIGAQHPILDAPLSSATDGFLSATMEDGFSVSRNGFEQDG
ncbi:hypothetical protein FRC20_006745 [Serendipita sp. 405]|nr:hypothetical protein FRC16_006427 [Serendipita sp. 398]KAG8837418.1 hypothetical protein FRC20_006745 [Serendipita sp. 405]